MRHLLEALVTDPARRNFLRALEQLPVFEDVEEELAKPPKSFPHPTNTLSMYSGRSVLCTDV